MERIAKEHHFRHVCLYCRQSHEGSWRSEFHLEFHYKVRHCSCGRKLRMRMPFISDGNDRSLDERIHAHEKEKR
ncbi:hypothetical protein HY491_04500 [Candidatus Woesearchaeota archaeon]|nr:hypothetical protein [Candidatus Woesearchaeota archaeon]